MLLLTSIVTLSPLTTASELLSCQVRAWLGASARVVPAAWNALPPAARVKDAPGGGAGWGWDKVLGKDVH